MGVPGLWERIERDATDTGADVAFTKLAHEHFEQHKRPLRIAVDALIWVHELKDACKDAKKYAGDNHPARTFFYKAKNTIKHNIDLVFVFDGPGKPYIKRGVTAVHQGVDPVVREVQAGLEILGIPWHQAPGEGEAECVALEKYGIVDAVYTKDGDAFVFGAKTIFRPSTRKDSPPTHVRVYKATQIQDAHISLQDATLVAMMSGSDYSKGIAQCGPDTAWLASKQKFHSLGKTLYNLNAKNAKSINDWKNCLQEILRSSGSRLKVPNDFPNLLIRDYHKFPTVSSEVELRDLEHRLWMPKKPDMHNFWRFANKNLDWHGRNFAKRSIYLFGPLLLTRWLQGIAEKGGKPEEETRKIIIGIKCRREHKSADGIPQLNIQYRPAALTAFSALGEPENPDYDERYKEKDEFDQTEWMPQSLVATTLPSLYADFDVGYGKKRKATKSNSVSNAKRAKLTPDALPPAEASLSTPIIKEQLPPRNNRDKASVIDRSRKISPPTKSATSSILEPWTLVSTHRDEAGILPHTVRRSIDATRSSTTPQKGFATPTFSGLMKSTSRLRIPPMPSPIQTPDTRSYSKLLPDYDSPAGTHRDDTCIIKGKMKHSVGRKEYSRYQFPLPTSRAAGTYTSPADIVRDSTPIHREVASTRAFKGARTPMKNVTNSTIIVEASKVIDLTSWY